MSVRISLLYRRVIDFPPGVNIRATVKQALNDYGRRLWDYKRKAASRGFASG